MKLAPHAIIARRMLGVFFSLLLTLSFATQNFLIQAQTTDGQPAQAKPAFRLERTPVAGGAELLTIFGSLDGLPHDDQQAAEVPLVSLLRDTLGDENPENDRLRYLWMLTYTKPTFWQKFASAVPFLYTRVGNKKNASKDSPPPPVIDLAGTENEVWKKFFWTALQSFVLDSYGIPVKAATRTYRRNLGDYRKAHVARALAILSLYEYANGGSQIFTAAEMHDIQARLMLTEKALGGIVDDIYLQSVYEKQTTLTRDVRGHNWELLRQRAEAEQLYFEPLELPDGSATHALVWVARPDLVKFKDRHFKSRFLNIANPWRDDRLRYWQGYYETRYFDSENRPVTKDTPGARPVQMIPLALYGLDHPKIPILLVDFRDKLNPKGREMSKRVLEDVARNILSLSKLDLPYFLGRTVYDFVTGRRGVDINQPSRLRTYSQLKLLLSLSESLNPELRDEISSRMESVSLNPLENGMEAEARLAREQYAALMAYAQSADGLPAQIERDRRAEMVPLKHGKTEQVMLRLANLATFGIYKHREAATPELRDKMELARRLEYHDRFLREVARSSPVIEIVWNMDEVKRSLQFIAEHGQQASSKTAKAVAQIFRRTDDEEARKLCLTSLYRINNETAKKEMLALYRDDKLTNSWRTLIAQYLRDAVREEQRINPKDAKIILSVVGQ
ncbi:MAG: hypothetical protein JOZ52_08305 [Acidobacteria bacterium]|nr:hypothetical protein [Acidobacteriota bacterium]